VAVFVRVRVRETNVAEDVAVCVFVRVTGAVTVIVRVCVVLNNNVLVVKMPAVTCCSTREPDDPGSLLAAVMVAVTIKAIAHSAIPKMARCICADRPIYTPSTRYSVDELNYNTFGDRQTYDWPTAGRTYAL
jgi:hypothetical protein